MSCVENSLVLLWYVHIVQFRLYVCEKRLQNGSINCLFEFKKKKLFSTNVKIIFPRTKYFQFYLNVFIQLNLGAETCLRV